MRVLVYLEAFVSIRTYSRVQDISYIFPMIPALQLTSAGAKSDKEKETVREHVIYLILCRGQNVRSFETR